MLPNSYKPTFARPSSSAHSLAEEALSFIQFRGHLETGLTFGPAFSYQPLPNPRLKEARCKRN
jgi:hypothetical protein